MAEPTPVKSVNGVPVAEVIKRHFQHSTVDFVGGPLKPVALDIEEYNPQWPEAFEDYKAKIIAALGADNSNSSTHDKSDTEEKRVEILSINHVGSTAVLGLPAKALIDIDLVLSNNTSPYEAFYVPRLEAAGFSFRVRNPPWHEHRYFRTGDAVPGCSLHVWGPGSPEVERHRIFRDRLRAHEDDREMYAQAKRDAAAMTREKGEAVEEYADRKGWAVREIYQRAFGELGYLDGDGVGV